MFDPDLFLLSGIKIHTQFTPPERYIFNLWTAGNRVLGTKGMYWFMTFFLWQK